MKKEGAVPCKIGDKTYMMDLSPKAFRVAKRDYKEKVSFAEMQDPDLDTIMRLGWIGILPEEPGVSLDDFIDLVDEAGATVDVLTAAGESLRRLMETQATGGKKGRGKSAGASGKPA